MTEKFFCHQFERHRSGLHDAGDCLLQFRDTSGVKSRGQQLAYIVGGGRNAESDGIEHLAPRSGGPSNARRQTVAAADWIYDVLDARRLEAVDVAGV
jgi:hypothetical protein